MVGYGKKKTSVTRRNFGAVTSNDRQLDATATSNRSGENFGPIFIPDKVESAR